jgi:hypothetical protein
MSFLIFKVAFYLFFSFEVKGLTIHSAAFHSDSILGNEQLYNVKTLSSNHKTRL